jgi:hypothetical protein
MRLPPAVIVHGQPDIAAVLAHRLPVTLLSAPGAGVYGGCLWWRALVDRARETQAGVAVCDLLDCADASGQALASLRVGLVADRSGLVLGPAAPGRDRVVAIAGLAGVTMLAAPPAALNMALPADVRRVRRWLESPDPGDIGGFLS